MAKVVAYVLSGNGHAQLLVPRMAEGATAVGDEVVVTSDKKHTPENAQKYDTAIFWGYVETLQAVMKDFTEAGKKVVYIDLGYWKRDTYYKVAVNSRHPTAYFQQHVHDDVRRQLFEVEAAPYKTTGEHILIAGLSAKAAWAEHEGPWGQYEEKAVAELKKYTQRPIIYRAKAKSGATPIPGTRLSLLTEPLDSLLKRAWAVVTRHSNVAVDGLVMGVPAFAWYGVAAPMALQDLSKIEQPYYPNGREQWLRDISYCQWSKEEMQSGVCWRHLKAEGLIT